MGDRRRAATRPWLPFLSTPLKLGSRGNIVAGVTVLVYLVPQVMAYGTVAGVSPTVALWACIPALLVYALLGTSRLLSLGPESSVALMTAAVIAPIAAGNPDSYPALVAGLTLLTGVFCLVAGLAQLGFVADLLSRPVLLGYMAGIALLMIEGQLDRFLGISTDADSPVEHIWQGLSRLGGIDGWVLVISLTTLAALFALARWAPKWPGTLIAVVAASALTAIINAAGGDIPLVGTIPDGLPGFSWPGNDQWAALAIGALGLSFVAATDVTLTGRAFRHSKDPPVLPNTELRALGVANIGSGLFHGMPVSSSGSRTAIAEASGARTQGYSLITLAGLVLILLFAGPVLSVLPQAALAALVVYAGIRLIDLLGLRQLWRFRKSEFVLALTTTIGVILLGVLYGVLIAIALSIADLLIRVARPHATALGLVPDLPGMHDVDDYPQAQEVPGLLILRYDSPLFFANAGNFLDVAHELLDERPDTHWFALNCEAIIEVDATALDTLKQLERELHEDDIRLVLVRAKRELLEQLAPTGLLDSIGAEHNYPTLPTLVKAYRSREDASGD